MDGEVVMDDLDKIIDRRGKERRLGSLCVPDGFVSAYKAFEDERPLWDDAEIRRVISDPNRVVARRLFDAAWICDQGSFGSCNGWAAASSLSRARRLRGIDDGLILSGSFVYSRVNGGRDRGSILEDGMRALQEYGAPPANLVTPSMIYPQQQPKSAAAEAEKHKGFQCFAVQTKQGLRTALAAGYPCIAAVHVGSRFDDLRNGVCGVDNGVGNHAVCIDDLVLRNGAEYFDMANSWGDDFGDNGRGYLTWDHFAQTFPKHVFYAVPTTSEASL